MLIYIITFRDDLATPGILVKKLLPDIVKYHENKTLEEALKYIKEAPRGSEVYPLHVVMYT